LLKSAENNSLNVLFFTLLFFLAGEHLLIYLSVNIRYIDDDQVLMWLGAKEYANGVFHEPRFYGQAYNTFLEALVAVPFIWMKIPVYYAVPLATHLLFLFPFVFTSYFLKRIGKIDKAILLLILLLCMPLGYNILTSIPRGFITGLFFCSFYILSLINPRKEKYIILNTSLSLVAFLVNPNSLLISIPFLAYIGFHNYKSKDYYRASFLGLLIALPVEFILNQFYRSHPEHVVFTLDNKFHPSYFVNAISHLDAHFAHIGLLVEGTSILSILIIISLAGYFYRHNRYWFFVILLFVFILLCSLCFQKISEGGTWPFFSLSRMFLALPFLFMFSLWFFPPVHKKWLHVAFAFTLVYTIIKLVTFQGKLEQYVADKNWMTLSLFPFEKVMQHTSSLRSICKEYDTNLILIIGACWGDNFINYGGPALFDDYPRTFKPHFERRRWRTDEELNQVNESFIIYSRDKYLDIRCHETHKEINIQKINEDGMFYVYNNSMSTLQFLNTIDAKTLGF
jgi:hypothetical protein